MGEIRRFERVFDDKGVYLKEFSDYRWDLICRIHKLGIAACSSCVGMAAIATGKGKALLERVDELKTLVEEFNALEEQMENERNNQR